MNGELLMVACLCYLGWQTVAQGRCDCLLFGWDDHHWELLFDMLELHLLGQAQITLNGNVTGFASDKVLALLCYLVDEGGEQRRDKLATLFWGDMPEGKARGSLRSALYNIQKQIPGYIESTRKTATFVRTQPVWVDVEQLSDTPQLYRGEFLASVGFRDADSAENWLRQKREQYRTITLKALRDLASRQLAKGQWEAVVETTSQLLSIETWDETAHQQRMLALARTGNFTAAIQQFETCKAILADEFGIEPPKAMLQLLARIRNVRSADPQLQSLPLPTANTPLVGRESERSEIAGLLNDADSRLINIVGMGGIGKTRLAIAAAQEQASWFLDGVAFVSLAGVEAQVSAEPIIRAIATAVRLTLSNSGNIEEQLLTDLQNRELLLILDNLEHILDPAATLIASILTHCPDTKLLVTSREQLFLQQEWVFDLDGLSLDGATDLFLQTARRVKRGFSAARNEPVNQIALIKQICKLVEGLPLGIELAAALVREQSLPTIAAALTTHLDSAQTRYRNIPARHRSLRATFDYSWTLLNADERQLLNALSVFRGGFDRQALNAVASGVRAALYPLVGKSLVREQSDGRFDLHEVIRQYSAEQANTAAAALQHCHHFTDRLEQLAKTLNHADQMRESQQAFDRDIGNVRAAWQFAVKQPLVEEVRKMSGAYIMYMESSGLYFEGVEQFSLAVEQLRDQRSVAGRHALAQVAWGLGWSLERIGRLADSEKAFDLALLNARFVEDGESLVEILRQYALLELGRGGMEKARLMLEESLAIAKNDGLNDGYAASLTILAATLNRMGRYEEALAAIDESIELKAGNDLETAISWQNKGDILVKLGRSAEAEPLYRQVFALCDEVNQVMGKIVSRKALGQIALARGDTHTARAEFDYIRAQSEPISPHLVVLADIRLAQVAETEGNWDQAQKMYEEAIAFLQDSADFGTAAMVQELLGGLLIKREDFVSAKQILRESLVVALDSQLPSVYLSTLLHFAEIEAVAGNLDGAAEILDVVGGENSAEAIHTKRSATLRKQFSLTQSIEPITLADIAAKFTTKSKK